MSKTENDAKAFEILKGELSPEQISTLTDDTRTRSQQYFDFDAHGRHFRIYNRYWYAIRELNDEGKVIQSVCGHARLTTDWGYATVLAHYTQIKYFKLKGYNHIMNADAKNEDEPYVYE